MSGGEAAGWYRENRHLVEAWVWVGLAVPSVIWWKDSVLWVIVISLYANYKTAISAHEGRKARKAAESSDTGETSESSEESES